MARRGAGGQLVLDPGEPDPSLCGAGSTGDAKASRLRPPELGNPV